LFVASGKMQSACLRALSKSAGNKHRGVPLPERQVAGRVLVAVFLPLRLAEWRWRARDNGAYQA